MSNQEDDWSRWVFHRRDDGDQALRQPALDHMADIRDRVLAAAAPMEGATLLDVGTAMVSSVWPPSSGSAPAVM